MLLDSFVVVVVNLALVPITLHQETHQSDGQAQCEEANIGFHDCTSRKKGLRVERVLRLFCLSLLCL